MFKQQNSQLQYYAEGAEIVASITMQLSEQSTVILTTI